MYLLMKGIWVSFRGCWGWNIVSFGVINVLVCKDKFVVNVDV